jgi:HTH-type transcriptional regulator/antitoxin HigA
MSEYPMPRAFPIHNDTDHRRAIDLIESLWNAPAGSPEADLLDVMSTLVDVYEKANTTLPPADPRKLIAFKLKELGWTQRELGRRLGWGSGRVSEILSGVRPLTLRMVQDLGAVLGLPAGLLVHDARVDESEHVWVAVSSSRAARAMQLGLAAADLAGIVERLIDSALQPPSHTVADAGREPLSEAVQGGSGGGVTRAAAPVISHAGGMAA